MTAAVRRYAAGGASFRLWSIYGFFGGRSVHTDVAMPATFWWRGATGRGWHIRFCQRPTDYRPFSERQGIAKVRTVGPLAIRRLAT
ncbi:MAG: hypothetical protein DLM70_00890 [Chloroflexi bacterium]|nr:MAG: hypothetical protein DLM70_00890 [Chloroflexota bacterium]